jgi:crotonobetainyl-CoA:carnitine CoA-transferase CaiB-like acyl-CoA transferase
MFELNGCHDEFPSAATVLPNTRLSTTVTNVSLKSTVQHVASLVPGPPLAIDEIDITGIGGFSSAFDVDQAAMATAVLANLAFDVKAIDRDRVLALFAGNVAINGTPIPTWADLSGYYRTADGGHIQFHCNFPHHAAGVVSRLGCDSTREAVQQAVLERDPFELEQQLIDDRMIAAKVRTMDEWSEHPHAHATIDLPLITVERLGDAPPREPSRRLKVLDCSRVLAGPVAGLTFAAHGADVLLVGAEHLPSMEAGVLVTGSGKRNTFADLNTGTGRADFTRLLDGADIWIDAYRPGGFASRGFPLERCAPGTVVVQLCAFDWVGPWAGRRGFDSIVQSTTGIVDAGSVASGRSDPTPLPVQALDFCTGLLAAFAAAQLARHQSEHGGTWLARLSLLRTRNWLVSLGQPRPFEPRPAVPTASALHTVATPFGDVTSARPIGGSWPHGPQPLGSAAPTWEDWP